MKMEIGSLCVNPRSKNVYYHVHVTAIGRAIPDNDILTFLTHPRSLISAFVIRLLESIISKLATSKISNF